MSLRKYLALEALEFLVLEEIEFVLSLLAEELRKRRPMVQGRFAGMYSVTECGDISMATQQLTVGVGFTAPLVFKDTGGNTGIGPVGEVSSSDGSVSVGLSGDGQAANVTMSVANVTATLTWHDPNGVIPDFSVDVSDNVPFEAASGEFGTFVEGTTA